MSVDENWAIGHKNRLLYHVQPDMDHFREMTSGAAVIMGRKTWESLPGGTPLANRVNIVMTGNPGRISVGSGRDGIGSGRISFGSGEDGFTRTPDTDVIVCESLTSLAETLKALPFGRDKLWVIGGADIYHLLMPYCDEAYVTKFMTNAAEADCWMINLDIAPGWALVESGETLEWEGLRFRFDRYENRDAAPLY